MSRQWLKAAISPCLRNLRALIFTIPNQRSMSRCLHAQIREGILFSSLVRVLLSSEVYYCLRLTTTHSPLLEKWGILCLCYRYITQKVSHPFLGIFRLFLALPRENRIIARYVLSLYCVLTRPYPCLLIIRKKLANSKAHYLFQY
jgi:hypothetical protein